MINPSHIAYLWANSSLVQTSGYCVFSKYLSNISSCSAVKVVLALRCFLLRVNPGSDSQSESSEFEPPEIDKRFRGQINETKVVFTNTTHKLIINMEPLEINSNLFSKTYCTCVNISKVMCNIIERSNGIFSYIHYSPTIV